MEIFIFILVMIVIWLRWSRYYINKQIKNALNEVSVNKAFRSSVKFNEYLRYFKLDMRSNANSMDVVYETKKINIIKDENESVLIINANEEDRSIKIEE